MTAEKKKPAKKAAKPKPEPPAERQLTCFVVIGFGRKTDYATGRVLDLDKTYEQLIRPALDRVNVNCFRAIDANLTGSIDSIMYRWIYEADIVVADLSTLNANVFYELGVRHAQKPNTTIIIAESVLLSKIPFDLSSFVIHAYEHGGDEITGEEQERFVAHLSGIVGSLLEGEKRRLAEEPEMQREEDSPVYAFLKGMTPPSFASDRHLAPPPWVRPEDRVKEVVEEGESLSSVIDAAEAAKQRRDYPEAIRLFKKAIELDKEKPDVFLAQRLALVTYKNGEVKDADGNLDNDVATAALFEAETILGRYCAPKISTDPETLGLSGAINKRLFDITGDLEYLDHAIAFYERGFYVKQDYYNGINVAFMYTVRANLVEDEFDAIVSFGHAQMIRKKVAEICLELMEDEEAFQARGDKEWILMSLAEAYQGQGKENDEKRLAPRIEAVASDFGKDAYETQRVKLAGLMESFEQRPGPRLLRSGVAANPAPPPAASPPPPEPTPAARPASSTAGATAGGGETVTTVYRPAVAGAGGRGPVTIDADLVRDRPVRSIEVSCKIEYE